APDFVSRRLGLEPGAVRLVVYDEAWRLLFCQERDRLLASLARGARVMHLEHIGSTAVLGLAAKPILDMLAAPADAGSVDSFVPPLQQAGYEYRPLVSTADRHFFRRGVPRQYHLHLTQFGSAVWNDQLTFRDRLRADASVARAYETLKRELAS